jgi:hypothetical protein
LPAVPAYDPRKGTKINGRNLPWDALVQETGADERAEGGKIGKALAKIRGYIADEYADEIAGDSADLVESFMATEIQRHAHLYRRRWPDIDLTPTALAAQWFRVEQDQPGGGGASELARKRMVAEDAVARARARREAS